MKTISELLKTKLLDVESDTSFNQKKWEQLKIHVPLSMMAGLVEIEQEIAKYQRKESIYAYQ